MHNLLKHSRQENLIYLAAWGLLFASPLLSFYVRTVSDANVMFNWTEVFIVWRKFAVYLLLFLVHNFLLAPLLVHSRRYVAYFSIIFAVLVAFTFYQFSSRPEMPMDRPQDDHAAVGAGPSPLTSHPSPLGEPPPPPPDFHPNDVGAGPVPALEASPRGGLEGAPMPAPPLGGRGAGGPAPLGEREVLAIVVLILMFGANIGIKVWFRGRDDRKRLAELEKQNLEQQLLYLRYQINPHFFMNTLNNIHALVDIDPAKAQETIVELSNMMRFVLYEGNRQGVPLTKELEFLRTYVKLMQLRYTDKVRITLDLPEEIPDRTIPPLMLITFVENAFKHGISYQHDSFIDIKITIGEGPVPTRTASHLSPLTSHLIFSCRNSKPPTSHPSPLTPPEQGGVGLANVRKRLNLLYEHNYQLRIQDLADTYSVELVIPLTSHPSPLTPKSNP